MAVLDEAHRQHPTDRERVDGAGLDPFDQIIEARGKRPTSSMGR